MREHVYYAGVILRRNYEKLLQAGPDAPGAQPPQRRREPMRERA
jgi:GntR family transcriptional regulator of vanillate catabolism